VTRLRLVLATANPDKAAEIVPLLDGFEVVPRPASVPDVNETGETLEENASLKARAVCRATGEVAVADDTGLEVAALDGAPGVRSARYAGEGASYDDNVAKLLAALERVDGAGGNGAARRARFRTAAAACFPDGRALVVEGAVDGTIATARRGTNGFGYDPVFVPDDSDGRTFAEMTPAEKQAVSHRARAFTALRSALLVVVVHRGGA
jgi:XTP/dITP diphosphohydrolase